MDASANPLALILSSPAPLGSLDLEPARRFATAASQEARGRVLAIPFSSSSEVCPVRSVRAWLDAAGVSEGPIFRVVGLIAL